MKALILNSGMGRRMGALTSEQPKCMTEISARETILSRQLRLLEEAGVEEAVITTGYFDRELMDYCRSLRTELSISFVRNPRFAETNYIYSIYLARDLKWNPLPQDDDEFLNNISMDIEEAYEAVDSGKIEDSKTIAALLMAQKYIRKS